MADQKATALSGFTPVLTDILYGVDDPGGTPVSGKVTFQQAMDLFEANMTVPTSVSSAYRTSTILSSTSNGEGAALIGVEDAGTYFAGATVEAVLAEIGALLPAEANADVTDETNVLAALSGATLTEVTPAATDKILILDADDTFNIKNATWSDVTAAAAAATPEGTAILSTGEVGGTKFLREDGDGTCSWQVPTGSGDVSKVGTPADNQVGVWTGDGTIEGTSGLTYTGSVLEFTGGLLLNERADHAATPGAAKAELWVSNDTAQKLYFTDDTGADNEVLTSGSGATLTDTAIATADSIPFFDATDSDNPKQRVLSSVITDLSLATQSDLSSVTVEGTAVLSTGEAGGTKYLREDGDGTCSWQTVAGGGDVSKVGTPVDGQIGVWTGDGTIEGDASLTFDTTDDTLVIAASGKLGFGAVDILSDSSGTTTLQNIDALDATTEATIEAAIDTLANLTSIQGNTVTLTGDFIRSGAHSLTLTTGGATNVTLPTTGTLAAYGDTTANFTGTLQNGGSNVVVDSDIGSTVQAYDADTLKADTTDNLTVGFTASVDDDGTQSSGTYTPDPATGNYKQITNGGAFTLAPPSPANDIAVSLSVLIINNGSAGAITTSGFTHVGPGDSFTTTDTHKFLCRIDVYDDGGTEYSVLQVVALQ